MPNTNRRLVRGDKIEIYVHFIWTTWDRHEWITPELEAELFPLINSLGQERGVKTLALNGVPDHIHWLTKYSSTTLTCDLVKEVKAISSGWMGDRLEWFKWRPTYAAFSVSRWDIPRIRAYIENQKAHHSQGTTRKRLESADELAEIADESE